MHLLVLDVGNDIVKGGDKFSNWHCLGWTVLSVGTGGLEAFGRLFIWFGSFDMLLSGMAHFR